MKHAANITDYASYAHDLLWRASDVDAPTPIVVNGMLAELGRHARPTAAVSRRPVEAGL